MSSRERGSRVVAPSDAVRRAFCGAESEDASSPLDEAYRRGLAEGAEHGAAEARKRHDAEIAAMREELARSIASVDGLRVQVTRDHTRRMIELALEAASTIVRTRIADDDPVAARALAQAVEALPAGNRVTARLHPDDLPHVEREIADALARGAIELRSDEGIARGGCVVVSDNGTIDARVETAEANLRAACEGRADAP